MNAHDEETMTAEKDLRDLLVGMVNKPLMENLKSALEQHSFEVKTATEKVIAPIGRTVGEIHKKQPDITEDVEAKLKEFCERALTAMAKCPTAVASALSPWLNTLNEEQRAFGQTQHAIASDLKTLRTVMDKAAAGNAALWTQLSTQLNQLEKEGVELSQRTGDQIEQFEKSQREYHSIVNNRMTAIETALAAADSQRHAIKKMLYGGLALSGLIVILSSVDVVVALVR